MRKLISTITCFLLLLQTSSAWAWLDMGHMAVAKIAYDRLDEDVKTQVDDLSKLWENDFPANASFVTSSTWADDLNIGGLRAFWRWHGHARPYDPQNILSPAEKEQMESIVKETGAVQAIIELQKTLKNPNAPKWSKAFALRMLVHIVGDIHQPLHCTNYYSKEFPEGDVVGTRFAVKFPGMKEISNLHFIWDAALGLCVSRPARPLNEAGSKELDVFVADLTTRFPEESLEEASQKNVDAWREESYQIGINFVYKDIVQGEEPSQEYIREGQEISSKRLSLAGYRLAHLLNESLKP